MKMKSDILVSDKLFIGKERREGTRMTCICDLECFEIEHVVLRARF
jgi:hypothetical protein